MSNKTNPSAEPEPGHEHDDDLIVTPKGANRLRFILTLALVLFILVIFVVADMFQYVVGGTGGGGGGSEIQMTWVDPISGEEQSVTGAEFYETSAFLNQMSQIGAYLPDSRLYADPANMPRGNRIEDSDVTSFIVYEDLAVDAGIAISDDEQFDMLKARFQDAAQLRGVARQMRMEPATLEAGVRRVMRVDRLKELLRSGTRLPDPEAMTASWQERNRQYRFQHVELDGSAYAAEAEAEIPDDEGLAEWWREKPLGVQQQEWTEETRVPQVAWIDLDGSFDATALLEAFPRPEGTDLDQLAQGYYDSYKASRFANEKPEPAVDENGDPLPDDEQPDWDPTKPFEEVKEQALAEAQILAALGDLLSDLSDSQGAGEEIDLATRVSEFGIQSFTSPEGMTRADMTNAPEWGNGNLAMRLGFAASGMLLQSVVVEGERMYLGRVLEVLPREEPELAVLAKSVRSRWIEERQKAIAEERLDAVRSTFGTAPQPEELDSSDWNPTVDAEAFRAAVEGAGFTVVDIDWRDRFWVPEGGMAEMTDADTFLRNEIAAIYTMEEGQVPPVQTSRAGKSYLVRFGGERAKPVDQLKASDYVNLPGIERNNTLRAMGAQAFVGDSEWFVSHFKVKHAEKEDEASDQGGEEPANG